MGNTLFEFQNHSENIPILSEIVDKHAGYYRLGADNKYYDYLIGLYKNSSNHASIIDNLTARVVGTGFQSEDPLEQSKIEKYKINEWFSGVAKDLLLYGGFSTEIVWTQLHEYINGFYKVNLDRVRVGLVDEEQDESTLYYYSPYFSDYRYMGRNKDISVLYKFDKDPKTDNHQLLYNYGFNRVGNDIYPRPDYSASVAWIETDIEIPRYYMNLIHNNFMVSNILVVPFQPNDTEKERFEEGLKEKFVGTKNAASTLVVYSPSDGAEVKLLNVAGDQGEKKYDELLNLCAESIARGNRLSSPMLAGISLPGNLFGISDLPQLEVMLNKNTVYPKRNLILNEFNKINSSLRDPLLNFTINDINTFDQKTN